MIQIWSTMIQYDPPLDLDKLIVSNTSVIEILHEVLEFSMAFKCIIKIYILICLCMKVWMIRYCNQMIIQSFFSFQNIRFLELLFSFEFDCRRTKHNVSWWCYESHWHQVSCSTSYSKVSEFRHCIYCGILTFQDRFCTARGFGGLENSRHEGSIPLRSSFNQDRFNVNV